MKWKVIYVMERFNLYSEVIYIESFILSQLKNKYKELQLQSTISVLLNIKVAENKSTTGHN